MTFPRQCVYGEMLKLYKQIFNRYKNISHFEFQKFRIVVSKVKKSKYIYLLN
jgi:hypothetical protein